MQFIEEKDKYITITVKVIPNSKKNEILRDGDILKLKITALPIENKANKFVIEYFSKLFKIPKSKIIIIKGEFSRDKVVALYAKDSSKINDIKSYINSL